MEIQELFDQWARRIGPRYRDRQWLLSKWDTFDGVVWPEEKQQRLVGHICDLLGRAPEGVLLDAGCGGGWLTHELAGGFRQALALDISREMLKNFDPGVAAIDPVCADICRLPLRSECVDKVLCYFVVINMTDEARVERAVAEMIRVLRRGGRLLIGQVPDRAGSEAYDVAKARYLEHCRQHVASFSDTRAVDRIPIHLYRRDFWSGLLGRYPCRFRIVDAFNPFYCTGEPASIQWRFDLVIDKE